MPFVFAGLVFLLTEDEPKTFNSSATVFTGIATGSSIVSLEESNLDLFGTRTAFDNLINIIESRSTIEEVSLRLFTSHMLMVAPDKEIIAKESYQDLMKIVPFEVKQMVVPNNFVKTLEVFRNFKDSDHENFIYQLINFDHRYYSVKKIRDNMRVSRIQTSDLVDIQFKSDDPGICQFTLKIIIEVFIADYAKIKSNQSDAVVRYFLGQLDIANERLNQAERELLGFNQNNNIINYYEQTKHIASEKEHFDLTFQEIKMQHAAAESVLKVLEEKMSVREKTKANSQEISSIRNQLSRINLEIALKENQDGVDDTVEKQLIQQLSDLRNEAYELKHKLHEAIEKQYNIENTPEGVSSKIILNDWLEKVIEFESTKAQLKVGTERHAEFKILFEDYAPLGATMKRLERKIDVAEREYLSLLQSLNVAKLKQQNVELNSNLKLIAAPFYPIVSEPSKRKFLLVIAFMIGFLIPAFSIILLDFLDQNIKNAERAETKTGLKVASIFPVLKADKNSDLEKLFGFEALARQLILNAEKQNTIEKPDINLFFSIQDGEGKTQLLTGLLNKLTEFGYKILLLSSNSNLENTPFETIIYQVNGSLYRVKNIHDLDANLSGIELNAYDYIFIEIPGILKNSFPIQFFRNVHHSFLVTRANRVWSKADANSLQEVLECAKENKPQVLLNAVELVEMESVMGDLPKNRSFFRRFVKNAIRLHFFSKISLGKKKDSNKPKSQTKTIPWMKRIFITLFVILLLMVGFRYLLYPRIIDVVLNKFNPNIELATPAADAPAIKIENPMQRIVNKDSMQEPLKRVELVVAENKIEPIASSIKKSLNTELFYVMGGTFSLVENADNCMQDYRDLGYKPFMCEDTGDLFKISVGSYTSKEEAEKVRKELVKSVPGTQVWILKTTRRND